MRYLLSLLIVAIMSIPAYAAYTGPNADGGKKSGFSGPVAGSEAENVAQALKLPDNARITLTGKITSRLAGSKDEYIFKDDTGEIQVEISPKIFGRLNSDVTPDTLVRISGKMDKDFASKPEIEVKYLEILK